MARVDERLDIRFSKFTLELGDHLSQAVQGAVKVTVNGKIDSMRKDIQPLLDTFSNLKWGEKVLMRIGIVIGATITAVWSIIQIVKTFQK